MLMQTGEGDEGGELSSFCRALTNGKRHEPKYAQYVLKKSWSADAAAGDMTSWDHLSSLDSYGQTARDTNDTHNTGYA